MSKSVVAIAGIGGAGCLLLSLCMQKALDARQQRQRSPVESALEARFAGQILPPVRVDLVRREDGVHATVRLTMRGNPRMDPIAETAGALAWELLSGTPDAPVLVAVVIDDDVGSPRRAWTVPPPSPKR